MGVSKGPRFRTEDIFVDYPYEEVTFRWDHISMQIFRRFYGEAEDIQPVPSDNRLYNDALCFGDEISREDYHKPRARKL